LAIAVIYTLTLLNLRSDDQEQYALPFAILAGCLCISVAILAGSSKE